MTELTPPYVRSIHPPYRIRPRSAVTVMTSDEEPETPFVERLRRLARRILSAEA